MKGLEHRGVEGLERLFAAHVALVDIVRQLDKSLLVTLKGGHHLLLVLLQKEMRVVPDQRRLLQRRERREIKDLHGCLNIRHLCARANLATDERRVEQVSPPPKDLGQSTASLAPELCRP